MKITKLVLATRNKGKIVELSQLLKARGIEVISLAAFPDMPEVLETGSTFLENALLKARAVAAFTGLPALADDSGLVVDALAGAPGVLSARYGDDQAFLPEETLDQRNIRKLLMRMRDIPEYKRNCHFETVVAVATPAGASLTAKGTWEGKVLTAPLGNNGFGYDPVFWDMAHAKSAAQMSPAEKNSRSHRSKALAALLAGWDDFQQSLDAIV